MDEACPAKIVPTPVGVKHVGTSLFVTKLHCPHTRGGETAPVAGATAVKLIVPTPVGVNRVYLCDRNDHALGFYRVKKESNTSRIATKGNMALNRGSKSSHENNRFFADF